MNHLQSATANGSEGAIASGVAVTSAVEISRKIRDALAVEVERARGERTLIRKMDSDGLMRRAALRAEFTAATASLQRELADALAVVGRALALPEITLAAIREKAPREGAELDRALAEVRALASALSELDNLNRLLGQRVMSYVRAHLAILAPKSSAYDRRGEAAAAAGPHASTVVRVV